MERSRDRTFDRRPDGVGLSLALGMGFVLGLVLGLPALPNGSIGVGGVEIDAVGAVLIVAVLAVLIVPIGTYTLYQLFFLADR